MTDDVTAESPDASRTRPEPADAVPDPSPAADGGDEPQAGSAEGRDAGGAGGGEASAGQDGTAGGDVAATPDPAVTADTAAEPESSNPDAVAEPDAAAQRDEYFDLLLRKTAEFDNFRRRVERERAAQASSAAADLLEALLPVVDNLERALEAQADEAAAAYREGVELIHRQMLDLLRRHGVTPIETEGREFDPNLHQAVAHEESPDRRDGEIIGELRRGYMLGSRLLRAAMVRVAKA